MTMFVLGMYILAVGLGAGLNMLIVHPVGDYIGGVIIGIAGGFHVGFIYGKGGK